jgi:pyruvate dehydrogenase E2 component (dihydrolipoamide acetyltransferase)
MAIVVILPKQGQSVESCIIGEIKKKGDAVKKGDILFTYETDKASFEEESPADGVVLECFYNEGDEVEVLLDMMVIGQAGEEYAGLLQGAATVAESQEPKAKSLEVEAVKVEVVEKNESSNSQILKPSNQSTFVSPRAKTLAEKEAIDAAQIAGTGPKGRVIEKDVLAAIAERPKMTPLAKQISVAEGVQPITAGSGLAGTAKAADLLPPPVNAVYGVDYADQKLSNMRKLIAKAMHTSLQNSAQLTHHLGADARKIQALRKKAKKAFEAGTLSANLTINDFVCFAVVKALKKFPNANSHFLGDSMRLFSKVHLGLAVDTERGLMVPAVRNADDLSIIGLSNQLKEVAGACKKGAIAPELLTAEAATFTVSNLGAYGVEMFTPVINLPQSAILGVNTIVPRPKDLGDGVYAFVPYIGLSLTYDHRALDGGEATRFLKQIAIEIETLELDIF